MVTASEPDQREIAKLLAVLPGRGSQQRTGAQNGRPGATDNTFSLYALRYASASDLVDLLRIAGDGRITVTPPTNGPTRCSSGAHPETLRRRSIWPRSWIRRRTLGMPLRPNAGTDKAESTIANMRTLVERFAEVTQQFGPRSRQAQGHRQTD